MAVVRIEQEPDCRTLQASNEVSADDLLEQITKKRLKKGQIDVHALAEYLGLEVAEEIMDRDMSGYLEFRNGRWVAGVNILHHKNRRRFSLAHEIGHFLLHRNQEFKDVGDLFTRRDGKYDEVEVQANAFAAQLLMPEKELREAISSGLKSVSALAEKFGVSFAAMKMRIRELGFKVK